MNETQTQNSDSLLAQRPSVERATLGDRYRVLKKGEIITQGDEYCDPYINAENGRSPWFPSKCQGRKVGIPHTTDLIYRRLSPDVQSTSGNDEKTIDPDSHPPTLGELGVENFHHEDSEEVRD